MAWASATWDCVHVRHARSKLGTLKWTKNCRFGFSLVICKTSVSGWSYLGLLLKLLYHPVSEFPLGSDSLILACLSRWLVMDYCWLQLQVLVHLFWIEHVFGEVGVRLSFCLAFKRRLRLLIISLFNQLSLASRHSADLTRIWQMLLLDDWSFLQRLNCTLFTQEVVLTISKFRRWARQLLLRSAFIKSLIGCCWSTAELALVGEAWVGLVDEDLCRWTQTSSMVLAKVVLGNPLLDSWTDVLLSPSWHFTYDRHPIKLLLNFARCLFALTEVL